MVRRRPEISEKREMSTKSILRVASVVLLVHGTIELLGMLGIFTGAVPPFIFPEIRENWQQAVIAGFISGAVRVAAAVGVFRGMKWVLALGIIFSAVTFPTLTFYLPYGMMHTLLSAVAPVLLVIGYYGKEKIAV